MTDADRWITDPYHRARLLATYEGQIRDENRRRQLAYERLPWYRRLLTKRPQVMHGGYSAYIPTDPKEKDADV